MPFRKQGSQVAPPIRRWETFLPGTGLGGRWCTGMARLTVSKADDFQLATQTRERYGREFIHPCFDVYKD